MTLGPSSAIPTRRGGASHPITLPKWGSRAQKGTRLDPKGLFIPRNSPYPRPRPSPRRGEQSARVFESPRTRVGSIVPVLPRPPRREFEFPRIKVAARLAAGSERGARPRPGARDGRRPREPAAGDGRAGNKWFGGCGRDPTAPTFPPRGRRTAR